MNILEILAKKKDGLVLTKEEIRYFVAGYAAGEIPDYQAAAFLMAVCINGMEDEEIFALTAAMVDSGEKIDLSGIVGIKTDKHSTGGVGDKTTLILAPLVASCGVPVAKMSGRALGHTGGTLDKLAAIPGFRTDFAMDAFREQVRKIGVCIAGQSGNLVPADKKLYALRDVTATVESLPLIAASIMSKKIASGADAVVLDVKYGAGALVKTPWEAAKLAKIMISIGTDAGKKVSALITNMESPLGRTVGNGLEVMEAIQVLLGGGPEDLREITLQLAAQMLCLAGKGSAEECYALAKNVLQTGEALQKFEMLLKEQGGDPSVIKKPEMLLHGVKGFPILSDQAGYMKKMDAGKLGALSMQLGAGRTTLQSEIDYGAGLYLNKKTGEYVSAGETLATIYTREDTLLHQAETLYKQSIVLSGREPELEPLIYNRI